MGNEVEELREHVADLVGEIIGPAESAYAFCKKHGFWHTTISSALSGNQNTSIDTLARIAAGNGLRVRMTLEPIE